MFQPNFDETADSNSTSRLGNLAFVVREATAARAAASPADRANNPAETGYADECAKWVHARLTACYND